MYTPDNYSDELKDMLDDFYIWKESEKGWRFIIYEGRLDEEKHVEEYYETESECYNRLSEIYDKFWDYYNDDIHNYHYDKDLLFCSEYDFMVIESIDNDVKLCRGDHWYYFSEEVPEIQLNAINFKTLVYNLQ